MLNDSFIKLFICLFVFCYSAGFGNEKGGSFYNSSKEINMLLERKENQEIQRQLEDELKKIEEKKKITKITDVGSKEKFLINKIIIEGEEKLKLKQVTAILKKSEGKEMNINDIQNLVKEITNEYVKKGYVSARILVPTDQNLSENILKLILVRGTIENINYRDNSKKDKRKINITFPTKEGKVLNLYDLEQGVTQLNKVPRNNAIMEIIPGTELGDSVVNITNEEKSFFTGIAVGYNNLGNKSTGKNKVTTSYGFGDLVGLNEVYSFYGSSTVFEDAKEKKDLNYGIELALPFKYWDAGISYNKSNYKNIVQGNLNKIKFSGKAELVSYKIGRVVSVFPGGKIRFDSSINLKNKKDYVNEEKIDVSSRRTSNWKNTLSYIGRLEKSVIYSSLSYQRGINKFGARKDEQKGSGYSRADYNKYMANFRLIKGLNIFNKYFTYEFSSGAQYSKNNLYSEDKFSVGNEITVRGYRNGISGDKGGYVRNQIYYPLSGKLTGVRLYTGIDYGITRNNLSDNERKISGGAMGLDYSGNYFSYDLSVAKAFKNIELENKAIIYLTVSMSI